MEDSFFEYINFPHSTVTVSQAEMKKLRLHGGAKLIGSVGFTCDSEEISDRLAERYLTPPPVIQLIDIQAKTDTYK